MSKKLSNILTLAVLIIVFVALGYWLGSIGLLAGGAGVAAVANRARKKIDKVSSAADSAIAVIDGSIQASKERVSRLEKSSEESKNEAKADRLDVDPYESLVVDRPKLRISNDGEVDEG